MKKAIIGCTVLIFLGCGRKQDATTMSNVLENLTVTIDTVVIDAGEDIINLSRGLGASTMSRDGKYLYQIDMMNSQLNQINLDRKALDKKIPLEKEGPNGIGQYVFSMSILNDGRYFLGGFNSSAIFSEKWEKQKDLNLKPEEIKGLEDEDVFSIMNGVKILSDGRTLLSLPSNILSDTDNRRLAIINLENKTGRIKEIPAMNKANEYTVMIRTDQMIRVYAEEVSLSVNDDFILISNSASNSMYHYDIELDTLRLLEYNFTLTPNEKTKPVQKEVTSELQFSAEQEKIQMQIYFGSPIYDKETERFFRFGRIWGPQVEEGQTRKGEFFLFVFDKDLKLIGEATLEGVSNIPSSAFFKDGKLYAYVNIEDELGFSVFDIKLNLK